MKGLEHVTNANDLDQFIHLGDRVQAVHMTTGRDKITWNLTTNDSYFATSVYHAQFLSSIHQPRLMKV